MDSGLEWNISDYIASKSTKNHHQSLKSVIFKKHVLFWENKTPAGMPTGVANDFSQFVCSFLQFVEEKCIFESKTTKSGLREESPMI